MKIHTRIYICGTAVLLAILLVAGVVIRLQLNFSRSGTVSVPILMYHHINDAAPDSAWWVPVETFERHIRALREQGYRSILPADLVAHRAWGKPLPNKPVIISFDDGFLDTMTNAEPILKKYGFCGIVYLVTSRLGDVPARRKQFENADCLSWPEVRELWKQKTLVFGGHSHDHQNLAASRDPYPQVLECFNQIGEYAQKNPDSFCYPYGQYNERAIEAVRRAKFTTGLVCEDAIARIGPETNLLALPRVSVMGGRHIFTITVQSTPREIICRVTHDGITLEVSPRLLIGNREYWFPPRDIGPGEYEWRSPRPADAPATASARVEIWDRHRLLPLFKSH